MTRTTDTSRVTPPASNGSSDPVETFTFKWEDISSFNKKERHHLMAKFDAEYMDLVRYLDQVIQGVVPREGERDIQRIETVDGVRVPAEDILIEMLTLLRRRTDPTAAPEDFDEFSLVDMGNLIETPKDGQSSETTEKSTKKVSTSGS